MTISKIEIWSRGKYRDQFANVYHAFKAVITCSYVSYFRRIIITMPMSWGDSGENDCLKWALEGINEALELRGTQKEIKPNDERIVHHWQHVSHDRDLENPEKWREWV